MNKAFLGGLWEKIRDWTNQNAARYSCVRLPDPETSIPVVAPQAEPVIRPNVDYFRVWLCEMFLTKSKTWFQEWHPAVSGQVRLRFGGQDAATFSRVARPPEDALVKGVYLNYTLSELMPYGGGVVEIQAALLALKGDNSLAAALKVLQAFSGLVTAPLGQALSIAQQVTSGIEALADAANGSIHLGFHQKLAAAGGGGANVLQPGYLAVVLADPANLGTLTVREDRLHRVIAPGGAAAPLSGVDYMLFRIEGRPDRDDWRLPNIIAPMEKAIEALAAGDKQKFSDHRATALVTALTSPDLTVNDRRRVVTAIKAELAEAEGAGLGAVAGPARSLREIVTARAPSAAQAAVLGEMTIEEVLAP